MANDIEVSKTFQERIYERMRDSMADLMTDEDLAKIIEAGVQKAFFEETAVHEGYRTRYEPAMAVKLVEKLLRQRVEDGIREYLNNNPDQFTETVERVMQQGMVGALTSALRQHTAMSMDVMRQDLLDLLNPQ